MSKRRFSIDLGRPPHERFACLDEVREEIATFARGYLADLGSIAVPLPVLMSYARSALTDDERGEVEVIAKLAGLTLTEALVANLYYTAFRHLMGCTAVAIDAPDGPLHFRNLDWWSPSGTGDNILASHSARFDFIGAVAGEFSLISWPGFCGAFSGVAPRRFAVTLNAVIAQESPALGTPIEFLIRRVFESCSTYDDAVRTLRDTELAADCLLLVTGPRQGQLCVIERSSRHAVVRDPEDGVLVVTNDYRALKEEQSHATFASPLASTACARFDRATKLATKVTSARRAFKLLSDKRVKMDITVQQMVMHTGRGTLAWRIC